MASQPFIFNYHFLKRNGNSAKFIFKFHFLKANGNFTKFNFKFLFPQKKDDQDMYCDYFQYLFPPFHNRNENSKKYILNFHFLKKKSEMEVAQPHKTLKC